LILLMLSLSLCGKTLESWKLEARMYPVMSVLRRAAAHLIYVTEEMLVERDGALHVRLQTPSSCLSLTDGTWSKPREFVQVSELVAVSDTSASAAISLTVKENELAEKANASKVIYTLIVGPEVEDALEGVTRRSRLAAVRGVYRSSEGRVSMVPPKRSAKASYGKKPRGTIKL
jgi:hypothetical protein